VTRPFEMNEALSEVARLLAAAYLRLLRQRASNCQFQANLQPPDSSLCPGYKAPPE
jgi:hypothetical protein